jgi:hypothetical protein
VQLREQTKILNSSGFLKHAKDILFTAALLEEEGGSNFLKKF